MENFDQKWAVGHNFFEGACRILKIERTTSDANKATFDKNRLRGLGGKKRT